MDKKDLLLLCTYYKGEDKSPYKAFSKKDIYWCGERMFVEHESYRLDFWKTDGIAMAKDFPVFKELMDATTLETKKAMLACICIMIVDHNPMKNLNDWKDYGRE